jgi:tripartite-type tricarboxylate transporter receptor subunit TctC
MRHAIAVAALLAPLAALSQGYPTKPIRLIVPYPAGGVDQHARLLASKMQELLAQPIVVENRVGANGNIGTEVGARAAPDGYSLVFPTSSTMVIGPFLYKNLPFDPLKDFSPILLPMAGMAMVTVHPDVPARTMAELIELAKKNPGKLSYGSSGIGGIFHLTGEQIKQSAGIDLFHVPYKAAGPAWIDLMAGRIHVGFPSLGEVRQHVAAGKLRVLAVAEAKRHPQLPDMPTVAESVPGFEKPPSWFGLFGPAGLPVPIHRRLAEVSRTALYSAEVKGRIEEGGYLVLGYGPEEIPPLMKRDLERTAKLVKAIGIQPE